MQISNLLSRYLDMSPVSRRSESAESTDGQQLENNPLNLLTPGGSTRAVHDVLSRYNVNDITPRKFTEMLQSLRKTGAIGEEQFQELSTIRAELDAQGIEPDEKIDLVEFCEKRLEDARDAKAEPSLISAMERRLESLRKFALIQSTPEMAGLNSFA